MLLAFAPLLATAFVSEATLGVRRAARRRVPPADMGLFLEESEMRASAYEWSKEQPPGRILVSVLATYDDTGLCTFVGSSDDTVKFMKGLLAKHGEDAISQFRYEPFPPVDPDDVAMRNKLMEDLRVDWLAQVRE